MTDKPARPRSMIDRWLQDSDYRPPVSRDQIAPDAVVRHSHQGGLIHEHAGGKLPHEHEA